ncbi:MAG: glycosyltransferase N-terminal domain-containing protein [Pseudomonadota bacterium]
MKLGAPLYRLATKAAAPGVPLWLRRRVKQGKEDPQRLGERLGQASRPRPNGALVWMHGASVGESQLLLGLAGEIARVRSDWTILFTSQTQTSADLVGARLTGDHVHQMAPLDTPRIAARFLAHWRPGLAVFAEGEIWPNLIMEAGRRAVPLALINARMTERSRAGWARWPSLSRRLFGAFDHIAPADDATGKALAALAGRSVAPAFNLKQSLPALECDGAALAAIRRDFIAGRPCALAASTHAGEEEVFLQACAALPERPALIIAPRHPERADDIAAGLARRGLSFSRRSARAPASADHTVLLADTIGEMGLWYTVADAVYLGGATAENIGGHNPIEPLQFGKPVVTGPHGYNFKALFSELETASLLSVAETPEALGRALAAQLAAGEGLDAEALGGFLTRARAPLAALAETLVGLAEQGPAP